jgi:hypothetical protein
MGGLMNVNSFRSSMSLGGKHYFRDKKLKKHCGRERYIEKKPHLIKIPLLKIMTIS